MENGSLAGRDRSGGGLLVEAAVVSAMVVMVHSLVDDVPYGSRAMLLFFVPMGVVVAQARWWRPQFNVSRLAVVVPIVVVVLGLAALIGRRPLAAAWQANLGAVAQARIELADYLEEDWSLYGVRAEADLSRAIVHFEQALLLEPEQPTANLRLGLIYLGRGEYEAAIPLLERAYESRPNLQAARQALARAYLVAGRLDEAATLWTGVDEAQIKLQRMIRQYQRAGDEARAADAAWVAEQVQREE